MAPLLLPSLTALGFLQNVGQKSSMTEEQQKLHPSSRRYYKTAV